MTELVAGKYRLVRPIGAGGMGEVHEAENVHTRKRVAIKCIRGSSARRREAVDRLLQEARGSALVRHPNVVDVYDLLREGDTAYLVMEYLEGEPLSAAIERGDAPMHQLVAWVLGAMRGVAAAHRQGVIHRDIKPDNIFLAREADTPLPVPKVLDFGVCKLRASEPGELSLTRSGHLMGTPLYMPLEQLDGASDIDARADVYAFGVTLYYVLTGRMPVEASNLPGLVVQLANDAAVPPRTHRADLPAPLDRLIMWAIAPQRDQRLPSLAAFIDELEPFASERAFHDEPTRPGALAALGARGLGVSSAPTRGPARRRRRRTLLAAGALLALVFALGWRFLAPEDAPVATSPAARALPPEPTPPRAAAQETADRPVLGALIPSAPKAEDVPVEAAGRHEEPRKAPASPKHGAAIRRRSVRRMPTELAEERMDLAENTRQRTEAPAPAAAVPTGRRGRPMRAEEF